MHGIKLESCSNFEIRNNRITDAKHFGINLIDSEDGDVLDNHLYNSGFNIDGNPSLIYQLNLDTSNLVNSKPIYFYEGLTGLYNEDILNPGQIILYSCDLVIFSNLNLSHCSRGIGLYYCKSINISDSEFSHNFYSGIYERSCNLTIISDITALQNGNGIKFEKANDITIQDCTLSYNEMGIFAGNIITLPGGYTTEIDAGIYFEALNNVITYNNKSGIYLFGGNFSLIEENRLEYNMEDGIYLDEESSFNTISNNIARYNSRSGIFLQHSSCNEISDNTASYNKDFGINLDYADYNYVYKNILNSNINSSAWYDWDSAGIQLRGCINNLVAENIMKDNKESIQILGGINNTFIFNELYDHFEVYGGWYLNFSNNLLIGALGQSNRMYLEGVKYGFFSENKLRWSYIKLIYDSNNNTFLRNTLTDFNINIVAFTFVDSSYNKVINNSIYRSSDCFREVGDCVGNIFIGNYCEEGFFLPIEVVYLIIFGSITLIGVGIFLFLRKRIIKRKLNQS